eukprot:26870-Heterocapsa_arctica.AAC.1
MWSTTLTTRRPSRSKRNSRRQRQRTPPRQMQCAFSRPIGQPGESGTVAVLLSKPRARRGA